MNKEVDNNKCLKFIIFFKTTIIIDTYFSLFYFVITTFLLTRDILV